MRRKRKMLFRIGMSVVIFAGIVVFYLNNKLENETDKLKELTKPELQLEDEVRPAAKGEHGKVSADSTAHADVNNQKGRKVGTREKEKVSEDSTGHRNIKDSRNDRNEEKREKAGTGKKTPDGKEHKMGESKKIQRPVPSGLQPAIEKQGSKTVGKADAIHLSVVACGDRGEETVILLKSAVLYSAAPFIFYIFAEVSLQQYFQDQLEFWPATYKNRIDYKIYNITLPGGKGQRQEEWLKLFKPCASQRLFIPTLLSDVDSLIYVDTDVLFLSPAEKMWNFFSKFNSSQLAALAAEHEEPSAAWYSRFARHPYYGPHGLNSGVMLMNLTRIRRTEWLSEIVEHYKTYKLKITWGDQDLLNIYFHYHPDQLYQFTCRWNFRPDHCMYMSTCRSAEKSGATIIQGSRRVMHNDKQPAFKAIYRALKDHRFGDDVRYKLLDKIKKNLQDVQSGNCAQMPELFTKYLEKSFKFAVRVNI